MSHNNAVDNRNNDVVDIIKNRIDIVETAKRYGIEITGNRALCPFHEDHTPSMSFKDGRYRCFACDEGGDVIDLTSRIFNITFIEAVNKLIGDFNINPGTKMQQKTDAKTDFAPQTARANYTEYITKCIKALETSELAKCYLKGRGFTDDSIKRFRFGYDKKYNAITIPYNLMNNYYISRSITGKQFYKPKTDEAGPEPLFNEEYLNGNEPVFVVESPLCAMSIIQQGGIAISICGTTGGSKLLRAIASHRFKAQIILSLDNDEPGKTATDKLSGELLKAHIPYIIKNISGDCKDPNEALSTDCEKITACIQEAILQAKELPLLKEEDIPDSINFVMPADFSDAGNAAVFAEIYAKLVIYTDGAGYFTWDGKRLKENEHSATSRALLLSDKILCDAKNMLAEAIMQSDEKQEKYAKAYLHHAQYTRSAPGIARILSLARPALYKKLDDLDSDPFALNTPNGIIDLRDGKISPHDPLKLCTKITAVVPSDEPCPMLDNFVDNIACHDPEIKAFLQSVAGMALLGRVYQETAIFAYGSGSNGKSTFFNTLARILGDYSGSIDIDTLTTTKQNKGAAMATLQGKRLVIAAEFEEGRRLSVASLKVVASKDLITAERKYKAPESFRPSHTLVLFTNYLPRIGSCDKGTWRRILVCPFNAVFDDNNDIKDYEEILFNTAGSAMLAWAIKGAEIFVKNGYRLPASEAVKRLTDEYRAEEDWFGRFIGECCETGKGRCKARELYMEYRRWAEMSGEFVRRENEFARAMEAAGYKCIHPGNKKYYVNIFPSDSICSL